MAAKRKSYEDLRRDLTKARDMMVGTDCESGDARDHLEMAILLTDVAMYGDDPDYEPTEPVGECMWRGKEREYEAVIAVHDVLQEIESDYAFHLRRNRTAADVAIFDAIYDARRAVEESRPDIAYEMKWESAWS